MEHFFAKQPSLEDIERIYSQLKEPINIDTGTFRIKSDDMRDFFVNFDLDSWSDILSNRLNEVCLSYAFATFYFEMGIPDEPFYEKTNKGFSYLPLFRDEHDTIKFMFDYYVDIFFHKVYSALDILSHILFKVYKLSLEKREKIDFKTAVRKIPNSDLRQFLDDALQSEAYKNSSDIRNDFTHNYPHTTIKSGVKYEEHKISLGVSNNDYTPAAKTHDNMKKMHDCLLEILQAVIEDVKAKQ
jgi:hypothetical protein